MCNVYVSLSFGHLCCWKFQFVENQYSFVYVLIIIILYSIYIYIIIVLIIILISNTTERLKLLCIGASVQQVEFPEARIYEETLNILLYENRDSRPDAELMQATRSHTAGSGHTSDDDSDDRLHRFRTK